MLSERLQSTLHKKDPGKSGNSENVAWRTSNHALHMCISGLSRRKKYKFISSSTFYPATGQTFSRTVSKKVKLSASHAMLPKCM